jgi:N-acetylglucosaminyl-diphospho-decaprenol L-rhamnosyltransferase
VNREEHNMPPDISVSIVSYNTRDLLSACLKSLLDKQRAGEASLEIIVADNGSTDGTGEMVAANFPEVKIGYGRGNNAALAQAAGRYFFILNSDTEVEAGALSGMLEYMDKNPTVGMVGAQLILPDGSIQRSCARDPTLTAVFWEQTYLDKLFPNNKVTGSYLMSDWDYNSKREVEQVCGACFFVRAQAFREIGGFDPAYFMYFEDTDFCIRLRKDGWPIYFFPDARILHHLGASSGKNWRTRALMVSSYNQSRYYYYRKNFGRPKAQLLKAVVLLGAILRLGMWTVLLPVKRNAAEQVRLFADVFKRTLLMSDHDAMPTSK